MRRAHSLALLLGLLAAGRSAEAQYPQYVFPGNLGLPSVTAQGALRKAMGEAPWRLGEVRVQPWLGLRDVARVSNVFGASEGQAEFSDFTATLGAGLKAYLPAGDNFVLAAHILPEYVWWQDIEELSGWQHRYGLGAFGFFNRLQLEIKGRWTEQQQYVSSELDRPEIIGRDGTEALVDVDLTGALSLFGSASREDWAYGEGANDIAFDTRLDLLDRTEDVHRAGIRYTRRNGFALGLGYEWSETDFEHGPRNRSNSGSGPMLNLHYEGSRSSTDVQLAYRNLEADTGSQFQEFADFAGYGQFTLRPQGRLTYALYGAQNVVYSLLPGTSHFTDQRLGLSIAALLGWRTNLRGYIETGSDDYEPLPGGPNRDDDVLAYGGEFQFKLTEGITLVLGASLLEYDSNLPGFDREVTTLRTRLNLGGDFAPF